MKKKCILELLDIVVLDAVIPDDFPVQHKEDFIQSICRQITHRPAEQIVLCRQENLRDLCQYQFVFVIQTQHLEELRPCYRSLQTVQSVNTSVKSSTAGITIKENLVPLCISQHLGKERFRFNLAKVHKVLKIDVDFLLL